MTFSVTASEEDIIMYLIGRALYEEVLEGNILNIQESGLISEERIKSCLDNLCFLSNWDIILKVLKNNEGFFNQVDLNKIICAYLKKEDPINKCFFKDIVLEILLEKTMCLLTEERD